jgi:hypothetical protein
MGRNKKYVTEDQKNDARKKRQMKYYWKNKDEINKKNLARYHQKSG